MEKNQKDTNGKDKIALQSKDDKNMSNIKSSDNKSVERKDSKSDDKKGDMKKVGDKKSPTANNK